MTDKEATMPFEIWAYENTSEGYGGHWFNKPSPVDDGSDTQSYINKAQLIEKLRLMMRRIELRDSPQDDTYAYNQALQDAIELLSIDGTDNLIGESE